MSRVCRLQESSDNPTIFNRYERALQESVQRWAANVAELRNIGAEANLKVQQPSELRSPIHSLRQLLFKRDRTADILSNPTDGEQWRTQILFLRGIVGKGAMSFSNPPQTLYA